jgi:hypothetical protein
MLPPFFKILFLPINTLLLSKKIKQVNPCVVVFYFLLTIQIIFERGQASLKKCLSSFFSLFCFRRDGNGAAFSKGVKSTYFIVVSGFACQSRIRVNGRVRYFFCCHPGKTPGKNNLPVPYIQERDKG